MTEENYNYRTSPFLLRNQFKGSGKWGIPIVPKFLEKEDDFTDLRLIGFDKTSLENSNHLDRMVHFFLYDYKFDRVWKNPDTDLEKLKRYRAVLTPDFSIYTEMPPAMQLYNVFRNRWCGTYFALKGIRVIPSVSFGNENTFEFCFDGIEKGSVVAVSTYMVSGHNNHEEQKEFFLKGYNEMMRRIEPEKIICYNEPFTEMQGNIIFVDYDLSSWRYMNDDPYVPSKYAKYICGQMPLPKDSGIIIKSGSTVRDDFHTKGMGSAYGGEWRPDPDVPDDERFLGTAGDIKITHAVTKKGGYIRETKIGDNDKAAMERHHTDHGRPDKHSNPHDHIINWDSPKLDVPNFEKPHINYPDGDAPEFKSFKEEATMKTIVQSNTPEQNRFKTISDFKDCLIRGGEVEFEWQGKYYSITHPEGKISICQDDHYNEAVDVDAADELLDYMLGEDKLRDVITEVEVIDRTI